MLQGTFGDMSRHIFLKQRAASLKAETTVLAKEMTTGQVSDLADALQGRIGMLASLESSRSRADAHRTTAQTLSQRLDAQQSVVTELVAQTDRALEHARASEHAADALSLDRTLGLSSESFMDVIQLVNTRFAGRSLFAGTAADQPAVVTPAQMLDALASELPIPVQAYQLSDQVDAWFAPGGGYDTKAYLGSVGGPDAVAIGHGLSIRNDVTAQDQALRQTLAAFAKSALFERIFTTASIEEKRLITTASHKALLNARPVLIDLGARLGIEQEKAASGEMRAEAEKSSLTFARAELVAIDPYAAASELEQRLAQLDTTLAVTARLARLSLMNHLR